jgi:pilus assembly protein CpaB
MGQGVHIVHWVHRVHNLFLLFALQPITHNQEKPMKKIHPAIVFGFAALFGILAVFVAHRWLASQVAVPAVVKQEGVPLIKIVIAAQDILVGMPLTADNLALADWPRSNVPKGAFKEIQAAAGRIAVSRISAGTPLIDTELAAAGSGAGLVALIPKGERAMSIRVDDVIGVSGFVMPNTYVDVIGVETDNKQKTAKTILQRIKVLAIAQETHNKDGKALPVKTVTLQVNPGESEKLALQTHKGSIHLVLRNPLDEDEPKVEIAGNTKAPAVRQQPPVASNRIQTQAPHFVEIIRASKREEVKFKGSDSEERI